MGRTEQTGEIMENYIQTKIAFTATSTTLNQDTLYVGKLLIKKIKQ